MSDARREERMIHGSDGRFELCMNRLFCAATFLSVANNAPLQTDCQVCFDKNAQIEGGANARLAEQ